MSQLLKRAGLSKRPRVGRPTPNSKQQQSKTKRSTAVVDVAGGGREDLGSSEGEDEGEEGRGRGTTSGAAGGVAVDDQIAALERELEGDGDSSSDEESSSSEGSENDDRSDDDDEDDTGTGTVDRKRRRLLKLVSPLEAEKIEPLPAHLLPRPGCGVQKASSKKKPKKKKGPKVDKAPGVPAGAAGATTPGPSRGLDSAVKELMANYEARSSERVPFYCRVCQFQGDRCVCVLCACPCGSFWSPCVATPRHTYSTVRHNSVSSLSMTILGVQVKHPVLLLYSPQPVEPLYSRYEGSPTLVK